MEDSSIDSPYRRLNYRRLIAWPERIEREWPLLERQIALSPDRSVVDLGCGTGEHARHLASRGIRTLGIDRSQAQIKVAREYENEFPGFGPRFLLGDVSELPRLTDERFGLAICLGNVVPHFEDDALAAAFVATREALVAGGRLLLQTVNYERVFAQGLRHLPLNVRPDPTGGEIVFLRLLARDDDCHVRFFPATLTLRAGAEPPLAIEAVKEVRLRAWRRDELEALLTESGFRVTGVYGDMQRGKYRPESSTDLVVVARAERVKEEDDVERRA